MNGMSRTEGPARDLSDRAAVRAAYEECRRIAREEGGNFHWGFRFLPPAQRDALCALYAFARRTDDIVDEETETVPDRRRRLEAWRRGCEVAVDRRAATEPILLALADAAARYAIPREELLLLIKGCEDDLEVRDYADRPAVMGYCRKVAVTVGMCMLAIFDAEGPRVKQAMESIGYAFQLTNILRDVPEDLRRGRIYLPQDALRREGITREHLAEGSGAVRRVMMELVDEADRLYEAARPLYFDLPGPAAKTMRAMGRIYGGILDEIRRADGDVWTRRPRVPTWKKILLVTLTMAGR